MYIEGLEPYKYRSRYIIQRHAIDKITKNKFVRSCTVSSKRSTLLPQLPAPWGECGGGGGTAENAWHR